jgi:hypothetical protein
VNPVAIAALAASIAAPAAGEDVPTAAVTAPPTVTGPRSTFVEFDAGVRTPVGNDGVVVGLDVLPRLELSVGAGIDHEYFEVTSMPRSLQLSVLGRYRVYARGGTSVAVGLGLSRGDQTTEQSDGSSHVLTVWKSAFRANVELSIEHRFPNRAQLRAFAGMGLPLSNPVGCWSEQVGGSPNYDDVPCDSTPIPSGYDEGRARLLPYAGLAVGYAVARDRPNGPAPAVRWYGWQLLAFDVAAVLIPTVAYETRNGRMSQGAQRLAAVAYDSAPMIYLGGAPAVHAAHHRYGRMTASLALRALLPVLAYVVATPKCTNDGCDAADRHGIKAGFVAAGIAATVDDLLLAWD